MRHRIEIDGLRALAVLPVILSHAKVTGFSGGFVGVDVFFVISGFLISNIIYDDLINQKFSIVEFYERRMRRIVPALAMVIFVCSIAAPVAMLPEDLDNYAQSVVATTLFSNNVLLAITNGYWDLASDFKPLLHTWSLGIEEQFYLFYPIALIVIVAINQKVLPSILLMLTFISLVTSVILTKYYPNPSFYLIHTRAWELLLGALAAYIGVGKLFSGHIDNALSLIGLILIAAAICLFDETILYPSFYAVVPCGGTALILLCANEGTVANRLLSTPILVGIGLVSYSAYLWHQPIFAFARIVSFTPPPQPLMIALSALTLLFAYLSWKYVEQPFRDRRRISAKLVLFFTIASSALFVAAGLAVHRKAGLPARVPGIGLGEGRHIAYNERIFAYKKSKFSTNKPHLLVIGNSTARDFVNVMLESGRFLNAEIVYQDEMTICNGSSPDPALARLIAGVDVLIWATSYKFDPACRYINLSMSPINGKPLIVVGPKHFGYNLNPYIFTPIAARPAQRAELMPETIEADGAFRHLTPPSDYQDLLATMDRKFGGVPMFDATGRILSADRVHLTEAGAKLFAGFVFDDPVWSPVWKLERRAAVSSGP